MVIESLDEQVYLYLTQNNGKKACDVALALNVSKKKLHESLKRLRLIGLVCANNMQPPLFFVQSPDKIFDSIIQSNLMLAERIEQSKDEILSKWKAKMIEEK